jgi:transcriptional regulator with XRE-family HTH domain
VQTAVLHIVSLAQTALTYTRSWAVNCPHARIQLRAERDRHRQEVALLTEELRIKDGRMHRIPPHRRPHYPPIERMAILELRAARGWTLVQTAETFGLTAATISSWMRRLDEEGERALVQIPDPVNRFPDLVRYLVKRLKLLSPTMGKVKIAQVLARAGLHLAPTTVARMLRHEPEERPVEERAEARQHGVRTSRPNRIWHVDLTTIPTMRGFWTPWIPFALPQVWPFCNSWSSSSTTTRAGSWESASSRSNPAPSRSASSSEGQ